MADQVMHHHYRASLIAAGVAAAGVGLVAFAALAPAAAMAAGAVAGAVTLYAGGRWAQRKLGIGQAGRRWRAPKLRPGVPGAGRPGGAKLPGKRPGLPKLGGKATGGRRGPGLKLPKPGGKSGGGLKAPKLGGKSGGPGRRAGVSRLPGAKLGGSRMRAAKGGTKGSTKGAVPKTAAPKADGKRGGLKLPGLPKMGARKGATGKRAGATKLLKPGRKGTPLAGGGRSPKPLSLRRGHGRTKSGKPAGKPAASPGQRRGPRVLSRLPVPGLRRSAKSKAAKGKVPVPVRRAGAGAGGALAVPFLVPLAGARWLRRKARDRKKPAPAAAPATAKPAPAPAAAVPAAVPRMSRPSRTGRPLHDAKKGPHIMNHLDAAGEAATQHIGGWEPENASDLDMFLAGLPQYFEAVGQAFSQVADRLSDGYPVHPSVPERLREIGSTIMGMADYSGEAHAAHRAMHEQELDRLENPRTREEFWDVSRQG
jgi:hypothetical protein